MQLGIRFILMLCFFNVMQNADLVLNCLTCTYTTTIWNHGMILIEKQDLLHPQIHIYALVLALWSQRRPRSS